MARPSLALASVAAAATLLLVGIADPSAAPGTEAPDPPTAPLAGVAAVGDVVYVLLGNRLVKLSGRDLSRLAEATLESEAPGADQASGPPSTAAMLNEMWSQGRAEGRGPVRPTTFPLRAEEIGAIIPMGLMASGHVTPSDHLYLVPKDPETAGRRYDVLAVADGFVVSIQWRPKGNPDPTVFDREVDLKIVVEHSATCWSYVDHIAELDETLAKDVAGLAPGQPLSVRIPVKAGQAIGHVTRMFDFALIDTATTRAGFARPAQFLYRDPWKPHTVDPFDYLDEPLKSKLLAINPRTAAPRGGRIDYDVPGTLAGNWYQEGTGGYAGANRRLDYWVGHLTFAYHHVDPSVIVISIGDYAGQARQFWVKGNQPDPAKVGEAEGMMKYELIYGQLGSSGQAQKRHDADAVQGTLLAQLLPGNRLRVEAFPGKSAAQVTGFTDQARIYAR